MSTLCNYNDWINANKNYYNFYYSTYPFLKNIGLPLSFEKVKQFYIDDITSRNFEPNQAMLNCYELLFTYFCENYDRTLTNQTGAIVGKSGIEYFLNAIPTGISKSVNDVSTSISSVVGITTEIVKFTIIILVAALLIYIFIKNSK